MQFVSSPHYCIWQQWLCKQPHRSWKMPGTSISVGSMKMRQNTLSQLRNQNPGGESCRAMHYPLALPSVLALCSLLLVWSEMAVSAYFSGRRAIYACFCCMFLSCSSGFWAVRLLTDEIDRAAARVGPTRRGGPHSTLGRATARVAPTMRGGPHPLCPPCCWASSHFLALGRSRIVLPWCLRISCTTK